MEAALYRQIQQWHHEDAHEKILEVLEAIPKAQWDYDTISLLARALNNLERYEEALAYLLQVEEQGAEDPLWYYRVGYAYYYLDRLEEAKAAFERALQLGSHNEDIWELLDWCCLELGTQTDLERPADIPIRRRHPDYFQPKLYTDTELELLGAHIQQHFGTPSTVFHELLSPDIRVDIIVLPPTPQRSCYTLITMGMGAHRMEVPASLADARLERGELMLCLPPDWDIESADEIRYWPIRWLKQLARMPLEEHGWLGWGHTVINNRPFARDTALCGSILTLPCCGNGIQQGGLLGSEEDSLCELPDGSCIRLYQVIPTYEEELQYKLELGAAALLELLGGAVDHVIDPARPNLCTHYRAKAYAIPPAQLRPLLSGWQGPDMCLATDRILVEGARVGYLYREAPQSGTQDSGWRLLAGDESSAYLEDSTNSGFYPLNTLCNYDTDIIPLLRAPVGSVFARGSSGRFLQIHSPEVPQRGSFDS